MKRSFTLIELLITISIIVLMAVVAVPYFNSYSVKADLNAKTEEIKYFIETAYAEAQSPQRGSNGTMLDFDLTANGKVTKKIVKYDNICFSDINNTKCSAENVEVINEESISSAGYSFTSPRIIPTGNLTIASPQIKILSATNGVKSYLCYYSLPPTSPPSFSCNNTDKGFSMIITKGSYNQRVLITHMNPFAIDIN